MPITAFLYGDLMLISREYDYALRIVRALDNNGRLTVKQICINEHIPQPFAYKIVKKLGQASILKGHRGAHGGYELIASLQELTLYDVFIAVEGDINISECMQESYDCPNNKNGNHCKIHSKLLHVQNNLILNLRGINLAQTLESES